MTSKVQEIGKTTCPRCGGTGKLPNDSGCPHCGGTGLVPVLVDGRRE